MSSACALSFLTHFFARQRKLPRWHVKTHLIDIIVITKQLFEIDLNPNSAFTVHTLNQQEKEL